MNIIDELSKTKDSLHHAYFLEGEKTFLLPLLLDFFSSKLNISTSGNPDFFVSYFDTLGIDDARSLKDKQSKKSFNGDKKIFLIVLNFITQEAQNSLLKIFEEPTPSTHFFVISSSSNILLPTLRSRFFIINKKEKNLLDNDQKEIVNNFIKVTPSERLKIVSKIIEKFTENKDKKSIINFLDILESEILKDKKIENLSKSEQNILNQIIKSRDYMHDRSPSPRLILEHLAVSL